MFASASVIVATILAVATVNAHGPCQPSQAPGWSCNGNQLWECNGVQWVVIADCNTLGGTCSAGTTPLGYYGCYQSNPTTNPPPSSPPAPGTSSSPASPPPPASSSSSATGSAPSNPPPASSSTSASVPATTPPGPTTGPHGPPGSEPCPDASFGVWRCNDVSLQQCAYDPWWVTIVNCTAGYTCHASSTFTGCLPNSLSIKDIALAQNVDGMTAVEGRAATAVSSAGVVAACVGASFVVILAGALIVVRNRNLKKKKEMAARDVLLARTVSA